MKSKYTYKIPFYLCNQNLHLRADGLLKLLVDASSRNTAEVEGDIEGYHWILYRWYINIYDKILSEDEIEIETYSRKIDRFFAYRNFYIYKNGVKILEADCKWLLVNEEGKIVRIFPELIEKYGQSEGFAMPKSEVKPLEKYSKAENIHIRKSDIDVNGHVNNSNYLQYIEDVINLENKSIKNLDLIYKKELKYGDQPKIHYSQNNNIFECAISTDNIHTIAKIELE
ncbi:acyl-[acyl-carrier-protein] thioesterase [Helcococcus kunzii]|uniref:acyl-[acyl-carrier-protein] thioesterase n=1 Tax=Helcococcus kunzii TaxID=40091 RepID=UPI001BAFA4FA|nr:acyl-ACP thioesterase domain-containing protein [Helcococcus kunzii]MCT1796646.1 thioesterase [Helcococcus kunzii]MCT1988710.1 thioesterase [Helcococcus kunzii]QUY64106.1 hypothetical protein GUI37_00680 [Helcococcus kunzii]QZO76559.1 hypothetical protein HIF96_00605 [Helcococcus kunzii]